LREHCLSVHRHQFTAVRGGESAFDVVVPRRLDVGDLALVQGFKQLGDERERSSGSIDPRPVEAA